MANWFVDWITGNQGNGGTSQADRKRLPTGNFGGGLAAGDVVRIAQSPAAVDAGITVDWTYGSLIGTLASALTLTLNTCEIAWTPANANACSTSASTKYGSACSTFAVTGIVPESIASIPSTNTDYSGFTKASFMFWSDTALVNNSIALRLWNGGVGGTLLDTLTMTQYQFANTWAPVEINNGSALAATVDTIELVTLIAPGGPVNLRISNLEAANVLTHQTLISSGSGNTSMWYSIKNLVGTAISLDHNPNSLVGIGKGWNGITGTFELWCREPILIEDLNAGSIIYNFTSSGAAGNPITYSGGWDSASMASQVGDTFLDFRGQNALAMVWYNVYHIISENVHIFRGSSQGYFTSDDFEFINTQSSCWDGVGSGPSGVTSSYTNCFASGCAGIGIASTITGILTLTNCNFSGNSNVGVNVNGNSKTVMKNVIGVNEDRCDFSAGGAVFKATGCTFDDVRMNMSAESAAYNSNLGIIDLAGATASGNVTILTMKGCTTSGTPTSIVNGTNGGRVVGTSMGGVINADIQYLDGAIIVTDTVMVHTAGNPSVNYQPLQTYRNAGWPVTLNKPSYKILTQSGQTVTFKVWIRRDDASAINCNILVPGGRYSGIPSDIVTAASGANNTWKQESITFTPTATEIVEIYIEAYGGTSNNVWAADPSWS